jgi:gas vesicle protein
MIESERPRSGALMLCLAFAGGALAGAAAAVLLAPCSGAETRLRIAGALHGDRDVASRMRLALREASDAAQAAFTAAMKASAASARSAAIDGRPASHHPL